MKRLAFLFLLSVGLVRLGAQPNPLLPAREALPLMQRVIQLMDSTTVATPELGRAGAPVIENARQALGVLHESPGQNHSEQTYLFLANLRAYMALADTVPKPFPFPEEARKQLAELRDLSARLEAHFRALLDQKEKQLRNPDRDNLRRFAEANSRLGPAQPSKVRAVFLGDSITDLWHLNEYFPERDFLNRGISGQITGEMLGRMKADVLDRKPAVVLILGGTNDLARGVAIETIENNLSMIGDLAQAHQIRPVFASVLPVSDYHKNVNPSYAQTLHRPPGQILEINRWLMNFCRQRNFIYLDYFSKMVDSAGYLRADVSDDGLHPNAAGYRIMAPLALDAIAKVAPASPAPSPKRRRLGVF
jgi:lysophospholipase L1-like esterase